MLLFVSGIQEPIVFYTEKNFQPVFVTILIFLKSVYV